MYALLHASIDGLPNKGVVKITQPLNNLLEKTIQKKVDAKIRANTWSICLATRRMGT